MQINYHAQFSGPFWKWAGEPQGSLVVLIPLPHSTATSQPHSWVQGLYGLTGTDTWRLIITLKDRGSVPTTEAIPVWRVPLLPCKFQGKMSHPSPPGSPSQRPPSAGKPSLVPLSRPRAASLITAWCSQPRRGFGARWNKTEIATKTGGGGGSS